MADDSKTDKEEQPSNQDGPVSKKQKLVELEDDLAGGDKKQINPQESRKLTIQRAIVSLEHACQCRNANCRLPSCQKMKKIVSHAKTCKRKGNGSCAICKQLISLNCYHAKNCQETKCPVPFCLNIKYQLKQQRLAQHQFLQRRIATTKNHTTEEIGESSRGSSSQTSQPSPENKPVTLAHVPQPDIGMKPSACPSAGALQAVQQVQAAAARQSGPNVVKISGPCTAARDPGPKVVENSGPSTAAREPGPHVAENSAIGEWDRGSSSQLSSENKPLTLAHVTQPRIGMQPSSCPPAGALQAVQQVLDAAARQSGPHVVENSLSPNSSAQCSCLKVMVSTVYMQPGTSARESLSHVVENSGPVTAEQPGEGSANNLENPRNMDSF